ncbi:MAG: hypothetical protein ABIH39_01450, partial [Candidatus Margulisiibacteriota bacterium]
VPGREMIVTLYISNDKNDFLKEVEVQYNEVVFKEKGKNAVTLRGRDYKYDQVGKGTPAGLFANKLSAENIRKHAGFESFTRADLSMLLDCKAYPGIVRTVLEGYSSEVEQISANLPKEITYASKLELDLKVYDREQLGRKEGEIANVSSVDGKETTELKDLRKMIKGYEFVVKGWSKASPYILVQNVDGDQIRLALPIEPVIKTEFDNGKLFFSLIGDEDVYPEMPARDNDAVNKKDAVVTPITTDKSLKNTPTNTTAVSDKSETGMSMIRDEDIFEDEPGDDEMAIPEKPASVPEDNLLAIPLVRDEDIFKEEPGDDEYDSDFVLPSIPSVEEDEKQDKGNNIGTRRKIIAPGYKKWDGSALNIKDARDGIR